MIVDMWARIDATAYNCGVYCVRVGWVTTRQSVFHFFMPAFGRVS